MQISIAPVPFKDWELSIRRFGRDIFPPKVDNEHVFVRPTEEVDIFEIVATWTRDRVGGEVRATFDVTKEPILVGIDRLRRRQHSQAA